MPTLTTEIKAEADIDISVYCATCGAGLCNQSNVGVRHDGENFIEVEVCKKCEDLIRDDEYKKGYDEGYEEARKEFENQELLEAK